uniref:Mitochondrial import receptor subunit TOM20 n=1 Tax=Panagrolaimus sp. JU765 TaxID=591449 RepID=A0AC34RBQ8_9BILA
MEQTVSSISNLPWRNILLGGAAAFAAYAVYFDYKRTHHPNYQQHIRENRARKAGLKGNYSSNVDIALPNMGNPQEVQNFFLQEIQIGEELMASGQRSLVEEGAEHLALAILFCGQSEQLMTIFEQTFPAEHFNLVQSKLPSAKARLNNHLLSFRGVEGRESGDTMTTPQVIPIDDDDLE